MSGYSILSRAEYFSELARKINDAKSGDRIAVATMDFEPKDRAVNKIADSLIKAAARGVKTTLIVDAYCFMAGDSLATPGPLFWRTKLPKHLSKNHGLKLEKLEELKRASGDYKIVNWPTRRFTPPFKGRSHIKFAVINNDLFVGNCNLDKEDQLDLMVGWHDAIAAGWLYGFAEKITKTGSIRESLDSKKDDQLRLSANSRLLIDAGRPNQSTIFEEALKMIDSAQESIVFACQYFPDKTVLDHLVSAHNRSVDIRLIYNNPLNRSPVLAVAHYLNKAKNRLTMPSYLFKDQLPRKSTYLHAKLIATDQAVMVGSHNFVEAGVKFGTAELALYVNDRQFSKDCVKSLTDQL